VVFKLTRCLGYANYIEGLAKGGSAPRPIASLSAMLVRCSRHISPAKRAGRQIRRRQYRRQRPFFTTDVPSAMCKQMYGQFGKQRNRAGVQCVRRAVKGLRVLGGLTLTGGQDQAGGGANDGKRVVGVPRRRPRSVLDWDVPGYPVWHLNARLMHTSSQYANAATPSVASWTPHRRRALPGRSGQ
jgi:iron complex outermembrane receptor protein